MNAALHSIPVIVTPCTEKVKGLWRWRRVHTRSIHTVNSVTRSKLVTYSEPQALIFHHTVAAGFYTVKQPEYVYTQSKQEQGVHLMRFFFSAGRSAGGSDLFSRLWW